MIPSRTSPRAGLRIADLKDRGPATTVALKNTKVPAIVADQIEAVARDLGCTKTDAIVALLNEGLERAAAESELAR